MNGPPWWPAWLAVLVLALVLGAVALAGRRRDARAAVRAAADRAPVRYWAVRGTWAGDGGPWSTRHQSFTISAGEGSAPDLSYVLAAQPDLDVLHIELQPWPEDGRPPMWPA